MSDLISSANGLLAEVYQSIKDAIRQAVGNNAYGETAEAAADLTEQFRLYKALLAEPAPAAPAVANDLTILQILLAQSFNQAVKNEGGKNNGVGLARMANQIAELEIDIRNSNKPKERPSFSF